MAEELFRVILKGYKPGKGEHYVEQDFARLCKLTPEKAKTLLQSAPKKIKENLSKKEAEKFKAAIEQTGAACEIESMKYDFDGLSLQ
ncbi:MAG TPA: ribosomal protein L7/L12 [Gammaproteobacteria bacterium]|nr:ribosomal protein L7/L12 [Gammaproteobacteria bacterium]